MGFWGICWVKSIFDEIFFTNTQLYEYLGMSMGIDSQFLGYWVFSMGWVKIIFNENFSKNTQFYEYLGMSMGIDSQFLGYWVLSMG